MRSFFSRPRLPFFTLAALAFGLLGFGLYLQETKHVVPCPMCIMQRVAFIVLGAIALGAALHGSQGKMRSVYGALLLTTALVGGGIALNQTILQLNPPKLETGCGADFGYLMETFSISEWLPMVFKGQGDCSAVDWRFLGLSIANWSLVCFSATFVGSLYGLWVQYSNTRLKS